MKLARIRLLLAALAVLAIACGGAAWAGVFFTAFDTPVSGEAAFDAAYAPLNFTGSSGGTIAVDLSGRAVISAPSGNQQLALLPALGNTTRLSALVGASNSNGNYNVGFRIGQNNICFHPGYAGAALRVEGPGGFGNTNIGFTPANGVLHLLQARINPATGLITIRLTDGANPSNSFSTSFTNLGSVNAPSGLRREGGTAGTGLYDNFRLVYGSTAFFEAFDLDVANAAQFANPYCDFALSLGGGTIDVVNGVVRMGPGAGQDQTATVPSPGFLLRVQADVGATASGGSYNVGLTIGQNNLVFHPGLAGGAFRVEGPGGFWNTDMGFTPLNSSLYHFEVDVTPAGLFNITVTDLANLSNTFHATFTNPGSVGGAIGFRRSGPTEGLGLYDNLQVDLIPEPASLTLLALGGLALLRRRRR